MVRDLGWEGLVCWIKDQHTIVREGGNPKRERTASSGSPSKKETSLRRATISEAENCPTLSGGLSLEEIDPNDKLFGMRRDCGNVGTGFDAELRKEALTWDYPCVVEIKYDCQQPSGKLRFPVFVRKRDDKAIDECIGLELPEDE
jgi:hypothetical protein